MIIHKCDKCTIVSEQAKGQQANLPKDWYAIRYSCGYSRGYQDYEICPKCREALKIPAESDAAKVNVGDRLLEIIGELVDEAIGEAMP